MSISSHTHPRTYLTLTHALISHSPTHLSHNILIIIRVVSLIRGQRRENALLSGFYFSADGRKALIPIKGRGLFWLSFDIKIMVFNDRFHDFFKKVLFYSVNKVMDFIS